MLIYCNKVPSLREGIDEDTKTVEDAEIHLYLCADFEPVKRFVPDEGHHFYLKPLCGFAAYKRMIYAMSRAKEIPIFLQRVLFGGNTAYNSSLGNAEEQSYKSLSRHVDRGALQYIMHGKETGHLPMDDMQNKTILIALGVMGAAEPGSSSMSLIMGTHGTGKTRTIVNYIGALLHYSRYGHVGMDQQNLLDVVDQHMRAAKDKSALKLLVVCASNEGVDNVLRKMKDGIPDGRGGVFYPQAVRCARRGYEYRSLAEYSVNNKALPFANHKIPEEHRLSYATSKSKKQFGAECIIFFCTASSSGSSTFTELGQRCDNIIIDEGGQLLEPEMIIQLIYGQRGPTRRMHVVQVADYRQLPPVSQTDHLIRVNLKTQTYFRYQDQVKSAIERLYRKHRAPLGMLNILYRMHPAISNLHSQAFYSGAVKSGLPPAVFAAPYNQGPKANYRPFTILDTLNDDARFELDQGDGKYVNDLESDMVEKVVRNLISIAGEKVLEKNIAVIAPYQAQVDYIRARQDRGLLQNSEFRKRMDVLVVTVDAMQEGERDVIIFSVTRSSEDRRRGFLDNWKRLNIAVSRVKKLIVMIGDTNTLSTHEHFHYFISACQEGERDPQGQLKLVDVSK